MRTGIKASIAAAAAAVIVAGTATPARAASVDSMCGAVAGSYAAKNRILLCADIEWWIGDAEADFTLRSQVFFDPGTTSATNCKVTMYAELDKPGSNVWKSPKNTQSCKWALDHKGSNQSISHLSSLTSATVVKAHACIDLYYNNSTSSGWQRCMVGAWEDNPNN